MKIEFSEDELRQLILGEVKFLLKRQFSSEWSLTDMVRQQVKEATEAVIETTLGKSLEDAIREEIAKLAETRIAYEITASASFKAIVDKVVQENKLSVQNRTEDRLEEVLPKNIDTLLRENLYEYINEALKNKLEERGYD